MKKLSLALLALLLPGSALAARQFVTAPNFRVGDTPNIMIAADFNGDGNLDLASTHVGILANGCVIQLGNGNGTFHSASQAIDTTNPLFSLVTADFNRDGKPDIALTTETDSEIWLGNGDGTFTEFSTPSLINSAFIAGDFNNDGIPDLLVLNLSQSMLLGNGDGSFRNGPPGINNLPQGPLTITDVNGDGKLDMVFATYERFARHRVPRQRRRRRVLSSRLPDRVQQYLPQHPCVWRFQRRWPARPCGAGRFRRPKACPGHHLPQPGGGHLWNADHHLGRWHDNQ